MPHFVIFLAKMENEPRNCVAFILVQKIEAEQSSNESFYIKVVRNKVQNGVSNEAYSAATSYQLLDDNNTAHFDNEFSLPFTVVKKGEKFAKKVIEIQLFSTSKKEKTEIKLCRWKFDAANLPDPKDPSIRNSIIDSPIGKVNLYIRFCVIPGDELPGGIIPENYFSFITNRLRSLEIKNKIESNGVSDVDAEYTDSEFATLTTKKIGRKHSFSLLADDLEKPIQENEAEAEKKPKKGKKKKAKEGEGTGEESKEKKKKSKKKDKDEKDKDKEKKEGKEKKEKKLKKKSKETKESEAENKQEEGEENKQEGEEDFNDNFDDIDDIDEGGDASDQLLAFQALAAQVQKEEKDKEEAERKAEEEKIRAQKEKEENERIEKERQEKEKAEQMRRELEEKIERERKIAEEKRLAMEREKEEKLLAEKKRLEEMKAEAIKKAEMERQKLEKQRQEEERKRLEAIEREKQLMEERRIFNEKQKEEEKRKHQELERKQKQEEEERKRKEEEERKRKEAEERKRKEEEEKKRKKEEERKRKKDEENKRKEEEKRKQKEEEERKRKQQEGRKAEEEKRKQQEEIRKQKELEEKKKHADEEIKHESVEENDDSYDDVEEEEEEERKEEALKSPPPVVETIGATINAEEHQRLLLDSALKECATEFSNKLFVSLVVPSNRPINFSEKLIQPIRQYGIFKFNCLTAEDINKLLNPVLKTFNFAIQGRNKTESLVGVISTMINFGLMLSTLAGPYTNSHIDFLKNIEKYIANGMNILMQSLLATVGQTICDDGFEFADDIAVNNLKNVATFFNESIKQFNIPDMVIQRIVVTCCSYLDYMVFNVIIESNGAITEQKIDKLHNNIKKIQRQFNCISSNFAAAFTHTLGFINIARAFSNNAPAERIRGKGPLYRHIAERIVPAITLPGRLTFADIGPKSEAKRFKVPIPTTSTEFSFEWLMVSSLTEDFDDE